jgi:hypothetical protein
MSQGVNLPGVTRYSRGGEGIMRKRNWLQLVVCPNMERIGPAEIKYFYIVGSRNKTSLNISINNSIDLHVRKILEPNT